MGRQAFGTHMVYRETFVKIRLRLLQHLIRRNWIHRVQACQNRFTYQRRRRVKAKRQFKIRDASPDRQPEIQSSSVRETSKNYGADQQRLQISDLPFDKIPAPATFACWKKRFKTEVCICSQFPTEAMLWIKEVELADSVDGLRSSSSIRSIPMPDFEVLDARIASALNQIIHNSPFKRRVSLEEQKPKRRTVSFAEDRLLTWPTSTSGSLGANDSVENDADLFTIALRKDDIQEFDSKWDGILSSMTKIPPDDTLQVLYTLGIRESEKLKSVLELYNLESHQKKAGLECHRLKTMVARGMRSPRHAINRRRWTREGPELACVQTLFQSVWHTQGEKDEFTSCRGTVQSAWQKPPVSRKGKAGPPVKGKLPLRGTGATGLTCPCPTASRFSVAVWSCAQVTGKGWWKRSIFRCWAAAHPGQDRRLPSVVTHSRP